MKDYKIDVHMLDSGEKQQITDHAIYLGYECSMPSNFWPIGVAYFVFYSDGHMKWGTTPSSFGVHKNEKINWEDFLKLQPEKKEKLKSFKYGTDWSALGTDSSTGVSLYVASSNEFLNIDEQKP